MTTNPKTLLEQYEVIPKKSLGQNFLHDPNTLEKIVETAELMPDDTVVEIGAGTGTLTALLARRARHVISVELDQRLRPILEAELAAFDNVYLVFEDFLKVDVLKLVGAKDFVVVANIPYYITSAILRQLLESHRRPRRLVLTIQQELAERIIARPPDMSLLAVSVQFYGQPHIVTRLKSGVFWPRPEVDSAVIQIDTFDTPPVEVPSSKEFFRVARSGFAQKRKQLKNSLAAGLGIKDIGPIMEQAGIDPRRRAETLDLQEWAALTRALAQIAPQPRNQV
jgi:16S rRNA (adenine1518-N6/adenine1519-N6)-dimethyltransferase